MLMATAWLAAQDPAAAAQTPAAPAATPAPVTSAPAAPVHSAPVVSTGGCCGGTATAYAPYYGGDCGCYDPCACKPTLLDRLRAKFARPSCGCDPCHTAPVVVASPCCEDPCRPKLFSRLRGWFNRGDCCDPCVTVGGSCGCGSTAVYGSPVHAAPVAQPAAPAGQVPPTVTTPATPEPLPPGKPAAGTTSTSAATPNRIVLESQPF